MHWTPVEVGPVREAAKHPVNTVVSMNVSPITGI